MTIVGLNSLYGVHMAISSQNLKETLEAFKSQLFNTLDARLHDLADSLNDSFCSIQDSLDSM
jgi:hypothetical protein